jgi:hypothetical protein
MNEQKEGATDRGKYCYMQPAISKMTIADAIPSLPPFPFSLLPFQARFSRVMIES